MTPTPTFRWLRIEPLPGQLTRYLVIHDDAGIGTVARFPASAALPGEWAPVRYHDGEVQSLWADPGVPARFRTRQDAAEELVTDDPQGAWRGVPGPPGWVTLPIPPPPRPRRRR